MALSRSAQLRDLKALGIDCCISAHDDAHHQEGGSAISYRRNTGLRRLVLHLPLQSQPGGPKGVPGKVLVIRYGLSDEE